MHANQKLYHFCTPYTGIETKRSTQEKGMLLTYSTNKCFGLAGPHNNKVQGNHFFPPLDDAQLILCPSLRQQKQTRKNVPLTRSESIN